MNDSIVFKNEYDSDWIDLVLEVHNKTDIPALLIIDMQNRWISTQKELYPSLTTVLTNINKLRNCFIQAKLPVIHVVLAHKPDGSTLSRFDDKLWNVEGSEEAQIVNELTPVAGEIVIVKRRYSAFCGTNLKNALLDLGVNQCVIVGYQLRACILATALDAYQFDFKSSVVGDASLETDEKIQSFFLDYFRGAETCKSTQEVLDCLG